MIITIPAMMIEIPSVRAPTPTAIQPHSPDNKAAPARPHQILFPSSYLMDSENGGRVGSGLIFLPKL
jgi:hypothetical protein|tara:strand:+ start:979 stop:1179 length:201 start_codon:yes stop_codon:yes gene_type:complete